MIYTKDFSVIVPCWRGAIHFLPKLFDSIPERDGVEIIVVDNSLEPFAKDEVKTNRLFTLLQSSPERHAGGSRNVGIENASGKWLLFADADDYFSNDAFDLFYNYLNTDAELVYTCMGGIYADTGEPSDRGDRYTQLVHDYCQGNISELDIRFGFPSPCCKMVSHELVDRYSLRYDEIRASNDMFFSLTCGYYAKKIIAVEKISYIATINKGSLTQRLDFEVTKARLYGTLHCNQFLKQHGHSKYQGSVMLKFYEARRYSLVQQMELIKMLFKFRQNPFVGWKGWCKSLILTIKSEKKDEKYIVR